MHTYTIVVPGAEIKVWFRFMPALHESREKTQSKNPFDGKKAHGKKPKWKLAHFYNTKESLFCSSASFQVLLMLLCSLVRNNTCVGVVGQLFKQTYISTSQLWRWLLSDLLSGNMNRQWISCKHVIVADSVQVRSHSLVTPFLVWEGGTRPGYDNRTACTIGAQCNTIVLRICELK